MKKKHFIEISDDIQKVRQIGISTGDGITIVFRQVADLKEAETSCRDSDKKNTGTRDEIRDYTDRKAVVIGIDRHGQ